MPNILIRADATPKIGSGHIMRMIALGQELVARGTNVYLSYSEILPGLSVRASLAGITAMRGGEPTLSIMDVEFVAEVMEGGEIDLLIVDGYHFNESYRAAVRSFGVPVVAMDDLGADVDLSADMIVNSAVNAGEIDYAKHNSAAKLLCGSQYILLNKEILAAKGAKCDPVEERDAVLVTLGGTDPLNLTMAICTTLLDALPENVRLIVVTGAGCVQKEEVAALSKTESRVEHHHNTKKMGQLMLQAGLAVTAGGGTVSELATLGIPSVLIISADNQVASAQDTWCDVLDGRKAETGDLSSAVAKQASELWQDPQRRSEMSQTAKTSVDGQGAARLAFEISRLIARA